MWPPSILEQFSSAGWGNILLLHNAGAHRLIIIHPIKMDDGRCGVLWMPLNFEPFFGSDLAFILLFRVPVGYSDAEKNFPVITVVGINISRTVLLLLRRFCFINIRS